PGEIERRLGPRFGQVLLRERRDLRRRGRRRFLPLCPRRGCCGNRHARHDREMEALVSKRHGHRQSLPAQVRRWMYLVMRWRDYNQRYTREVSMTSSIRTSTIASILLALLLLPVVSEAQARRAAPRAAPAGRPPTAAVYRAPYNRPYYGGRYYGSRYYGARYYGP